MLGCVSPAATNYLETLSSLRFASQARTLKTKAMVNVDPVQRMIQELQAEVQRLHEEARLHEETSERRVAEATAAASAAVVVQGPSEEEIASEISKRIVAKEMLLREKLNAHVAMLAEKERNMKNLIKRQSRQATSPSGRITILHQAPSRGDEAMTRARAAGINPQVPPAPRHRVSSVTSPVVSPLSLTSSKPYLNILHKDAALSRTIIYADETLRIGRGGKKVVPQDLEVDGIGIAKETCIVWGGGGDNDVPFRCCAASEEAIVYLNGIRLEYDATVQQSIGTCRTTAGVYQLQHYDRVTLGHAAYIMIVVDPSASSDRQPPTYEMAIQEVFLRRTITNRLEHEERLASFVITRWRLPRTRAIWQMNLLLAVQATVTANAIVEEAGCSVRFFVCAGGEIDTQRLYSLRFEDALPHHCVQLTVKAVILTKPLEDNGSSSKRVKTRPSSHETKQSQSQRIQDAFGAKALNLTEEGKSTKNADVILLEVPVVSSVKKTCDSSTMTIYA
jgi:hypothetical protein